jgi:hypothetical protein
MHQLGEQVVFAPAQPFTCEVIAPAAVKRTLICVGVVDEYFVGDEVIVGDIEIKFGCKEGNLDGDLLMVQSAGQADIDSEPSQIPSPQYFEVKGREEVVEIVTGE